VLRLRMSGCIPLLPFYAFMKWTETILFYFPFYRDKFILYSVVFILIKLHVETVIVSYLFKRSNFYEPKGFITIFTRACHSSVYGAS
jgi:hypothetical protein